MLRRAPLAWVLILAVQGPVALLVCADCLGCPPSRAPGPAACHEEPAPQVGPDCCASLAQATDESATAPARTIAGANAVSATAAAQRAQVFPTAASTLRLPLASAGHHVSLFTLHSALLI